MCNPLGGTANTMMDFTETLSKTFEDASCPSKTVFKYGWCTTDHKDGKEIRKIYRSADYLKDEPYASRVKDMLARLGLPMPEPKEIFRGTHHDLLFLNSHGVVVRIGPTDVKDLMNPAILQPLGWLEDKDIRIGKTPFTVAIYPGIELYNDWDGNKQGVGSVGSLRDILRATGQGNGDTSDNNMGIIRVLDDEGKTVAVEILLDPDNEFNGSSADLTTRRFDKMTKAEEFFENKGDVLSQTLQSIFDGIEIKYWQRAFEVHQPLRRLFWDAFKGVKEAGDMPDIAARDRFWESCARVTNNPEATVVPLWRAETDAFEKTRFVREESFVPHVVLYRPWTGEVADKAIRPISIDPALRERITREHASLTRQGRDKTPKPAGLFCG